MLQQKTYFNNKKLDFCGENGSYNKSIGGRRDKMFSFCTNNLFLNFHTIYSAFLE